MVTSEAPAIDVEAEMDEIFTLNLEAALKRMSEYEVELTRIEHDPGQARVAARLKLLMDIVYDHIESLGA